MMTGLMLIALMILICSTMLVGGALFFVGLFKKKGTLRRAGSIIFVLSLFGLAGCSTYVLLKVFHRLKSASLKQYWRAMVDAAFDDTAIRPLDPAEAEQILSGKLGNPAFLRGSNIQGSWVEGAVLSYGYFLYAADEKELLRALADAPVDSSFRLTSDVACREITWAECREKLMYGKGPQRNLPGWTPESVTDKRCYSCLRCPWSHTILMDGKTGKVYHSISEIRE